MTAEAQHALTVRSIPCTIGSAGPFLKPNAMENPKSYSELFSEFQRRLLDLHGKFLEERKKRQEDLQRCRAANCDPGPSFEEILQGTSESVRKALLRSSARQEPPWYAEEENSAKPTAIAVGRLTLTKSFGKSYV
jgi:hypothetical protein